MDILRPALINIKGRVYRKNFVQEDNYEEEEEDFSYMRPPVITGFHKAAVSSAVTRVEVLVESFRKKQPFTHFLSFPLNHPQVQEGFLKFKEEVLQQCSKDHGVEESIFQNPAKLHLTIGTLALLNDMEVRKACEHLEECENIIRDITEGKPLQLEVTGIEYMNDDPAMVDVLYAKVGVQDGSNKLQVIADRLVEHFVSAGLMVREWDRVKLHGTVMNTRYRKDHTGRAQPINDKLNSSSFQKQSY
ncbi:hypothetical protein fugu_000497 [Takifugu bimaculatus]|uniref:A-kinase anchor protein 7-like phosphoesterase domain-containing protein n=1 Tax=Takifugu bimaculatus TaxID=433685 RepID=A0A4Z2CGV3_9TELE|nr:hypothetical protein fugu_000497 [Takifugu bimaculatus]